MICLDLGRQRNVSRFSSRKQRKVGSFLQKHGWASCWAHSRCWCQFVLMCLCLSVRLSLHSLPQHGRMDQTWKLGQPQIKRIAERSGRRREETEEHGGKSRGTSFSIWEEVGKCRACIFTKALLKRGARSSWQWVKSLVQISYLTIGKCFRCWKCLLQRRN